MRVEITGIGDTVDILNAVAPREASNLLRTIVHDIAGQLADSARELTPKDTGKLAASIKHKRARGRPGFIESDVTVPKKSFYWRFLEYGDGPDHVEHAMFARAIMAMRPDMDRVYLDTFIRKLQARLRREQNRKES